MSKRPAALRRSEGEEIGAVNCGPGPRLRDGRLARSMTLEEAAELLKLDPAVLAALERDDFTALPESLYVRGYLSSYARLLGIPEQEVVRDYRAFIGDTSAPTLTTRRPIEERNAASDAGVRWFSYGLMAGIVALVGWWGYQRLPLESLEASPSDALAPESEPDLASAPAAVSTPTASVTTSPAPSSVAASQPDSTAVIEPAPPAAAGTMRPQPSDAEAARVEVATYTALLEAAEPDAGGGPEMTASRPAEPESVAEPEAAVTDSAVPSADPFADAGVAPGDTAPEASAAGLGASLTAESVGASAVVSPVDVLDLSFYRDCWVEIRDAGEQRLVYGLFKAGSERRVEGRAPFRILLGDSGAVAIRHNDKTVARGVYDAAEGRPARFILGGGSPDIATTP